MTDHFSGAMVPLSGRIEDELYQWFISLRFEGAKTNSDRLREALKELKSQYDGTRDPVTAHTWFQSLARPLRESLARIVRDELAHSDVMSSLMEHVGAMAAALLSSRPQTRDEAVQLEELMVRHTFAMTEALLRQAVTPSASAFDPSVVRKHCERTVELAKLVHLTTKEK